MSRGLRPFPSLLVPLALVACDNATEPRLASPRPQFDHDPETQVTTLNDDGPGSLREVAFNAPAFATIHFAAALAGQTIVVNSPITLDRDVTIEGPDTEGIIISGGSLTTVFTIIDNGFDPIVRLHNLEITGADAGSPFDGHGTAIFVAGGELIISGTTLRGNLQHAVFQVSGDLTIENSTISGNGGDGLNTTGGEASLRYTTIANNLGHGILRGGAAVKLRSVLIGDNVKTDCDAAPGAAPNDLIDTNLDSDDTCGLGIDDLRGVDPLLEPLTREGGPTPTHPLKFGSPAVDATACVLATDQRGVQRPQGPTCDIGAYERIPISVGLTVDPTGSVNPKTGAATIGGTLSCSRFLIVALQVDLEQVQMVRRVPVPKQSSATIQVVCTGAERTWTATVPAPGGTAFVNGAALAEVAATNSDNAALAQREIRLFWAKKAP